MKPATPLLSPEQTRAKNCYQLAIVPAMFAAMLVVITASTLFSILLIQINILRGLSGSLMFIPMMFAAFLWAHLRAVRQVERTGLSLATQKIEIVTQVETDLDFETISWRHPKTLLSSLGNILFLCVWCAAAWWLWRIAPTSPAQKIVGFVGFWMSLWATIVAIVFIRAPLVHLDKKGITAFSSVLTRRRVHWKDIASCEILHCVNYMGQGPNRFFAFKSAKRKTLLSLNSLSLYGLSFDEQAEIEKEIRRRLGHSVSIDEGN